MIDDDVVTAISNKIFSINIFSVSDIIQSLLGKLRRIAYKITRYMQSSQSFSGFNILTIKLDKCIYYICVLLI